MIAVSMPAMLLGYMIYLFCEVFLWLRIACLLALLILKARYEALRGRGKFAKVAIVACMRIFIVRLNAMLRTGTPWRDLALPVPENTARLQGTA